MAQISEAVEHQVVIDNLMSQLDSVKNNEADLVNWIGEFAEHNEYVGLDFDAIALAVRLENAGYIENAEVGRLPNDFKFDKSMLARYLVGQAITNLRKGKPIRPVAAVFAAAYFAAA